MVRVAIVDDNAQCRSLLKNHLNRYAEEFKHVFQIREFPDGDEIIEQYQPGFDIIFMDVVMHYMDGIKTAEKIRCFDKETLDRMIASGAIAPLIVITPTFYTEDDCADSLDDLTFAFREELRSDLMTAAESRYSTYAETADEAGFAASRDHRAFAGLSRGAVTAAHSALCGSLDEFSWFGIFSAFRTTEDYLRQTIQSEAFSGLPIHYLYMTSGNYDFALLPQIRGYDMLLAMEPRLTQGVNTEFDVFPMRYHSMGSWHLALYNFLQRIF